ncbi:hypothetical protein MLAC_39940 [Mycobacterium lacus]|uniref:Uncharacterized protein n=1 Tax=Mycobacterium lacus TaxID=169765 RepID=A0A7I7NL97_9MYCO|nr:hypothetical protein MLAC_27400 [Mycobacterium lacus]BBX98700.1 hypothetical protein MLAC_39940 [Mycobacterium lacus]
MDAGRITREMINANTTSRDRQAGPSSAGNPSRCAIADTAATCPCGSERVLVNSLPAGIRACPFSVASSAVIEAAGSIDRLATVSFRTLAPSRNVRRRYTDS